MRGLVEPFVQGLDVGLAQRLDSIASWAWRQIGWARATSRLPLAVTLTMRWRASSPLASSTQPAAMSGFTSRLSVVRSMPSSRASSPRARGCTLARRRIEYWLMLMPTWASSRS
nr:hypothetical protein [Lysobacter arenosi]